MFWEEFSTAAPDMARLAEERFERTGLVLVGTIRRDGTPRISPVEPLIAYGHLFLGMMWQSTKALDLLRDPRCLVHSTICDRNGTEGEVKLRGRVVDVSDPELRERYAQAVFEKIDWRPEEPYHLFALDIESAAYVDYRDEKKHVERWRAPSPEPR
jgi:hypothetical protein